MMYGYTISKPSSGSKFSPKAILLNSEPVSLHAKNLKKERYMFSEE